MIKCQWLYVSLLILITPIISQALVTQNTEITRLSTPHLVFPTVMSVSGPQTQSPFRDNLSNKHQDLTNEPKTHKLATNPLSMVFIAIKHLNGKRFYNMLKQHRKGFLSKKGALFFDQRTNTLMLRDHPTNIKRIKALLKHLDITVKEVLIDARFVVADQKALNELGVSIHAFGGRNAVSSTNNSGRASVSAPILNPVGALGLSVGQLPLGFMLDLELEALESEGESDVVSSPEIMVVNGERATIEQGKEVPYNTATSSGATQVQFKKAVLGLNVTPVIKPNDTVALKIDVNNDAISQHLGSAGAIPIIDTTSLTTDVLVKSGQTVVLGGIYLTLMQKSTRQVPFLGRLPLVGRFFRSDSQKNHHTELLVFIRPKIIR